jgi:hypothetical protein
LTLTVVSSFIATLTTRLIPPTFINMRGPHTHVLPGRQRGASRSAWKWR